MLTGPWQEAFAPVTLTSISTNVLLVRQSLPVHSVAELLDYGKRNPGKLNCALSSGTSINTFIAALVQCSTGLNWTTITYRGNAPAINNLVAGNVDFGFAQLMDSAEQIRGGTLRAVALLGPARSPAPPDVASIGEQGHPSVQGITFSDVLAPSGTPKPVLDTVSGAICKALAKPDAKDWLAAVDSEARGSTADEFRAMLAEETAKWGGTIRELHLNLVE